MWPFNKSDKQKLKNQDALKKYQEWLRKWMLKGAKFQLASLAVVALVLAGSLVAVNHYLLTPIQSVNNTVNQTKQTQNQNKTANPAPLATEQTVTKEQPPKPNPEPQVDVSQLTMPVMGTVVTGFNDPYYSETYGDYRFSEGMQFQTQPSAPVKAALAGKIISLDQDPNNKYLIVIDHGQGYQTKYQGLDTIEVSPDQQIIKGQTLGTTNNLKFTLTEQQTPINPAQE
ncbi:M23 family metallopeptidase [Peptococcaceae bacterium 1198_IL3148]